MVEATEKFLVCLLYTSFSYNVILIKEGEDVNKFGVYYASSFIIEHICSILHLFKHLFSI